MWVPVFIFFKRVLTNDLIDKVSNNWIRDVEFNLCLYKNQLVSWSNNKKLSSGADDRCHRFETL